MSFFRKRQAVDTQGINEQVAAVPPWAQDTLHAQAVVEQYGRGGRKAMVCVEVGGAQDMMPPARFRASEVQSLMTGRTAVAESLQGGPLMFLVCAGTQAAGSVASEVTATLASETLVLLLAGSELQVVGTSSPLHAQEFGRWVMALP